MVNIYGLTNDIAHLHSRIKRVIRVLEYDLYIFLIPLIHNQIEKQCFLLKLTIPPVGSSNLSIANPVVDLPHPIHRQ